MARLLLVRKFRNDNEIKIIRHIKESDSGLTMLGTKSYCSKNVRLKLDFPTKPAKVDSAFILFLSCLVRNTLSFLLKSRATAFIFIFLSCTILERLCVSCCTSMKLNEA